MIYPGGDVLAPRSAQHPNPDGRCPETPDALVNRVFGHVPAPQRVFAFIADGDTFTPFPVQAVARPAPDFSRVYAIPRHYAQICISMSRNRALLSIPPPLS